MPTKLTQVLDAQGEQMSIDEYLALDRDETPLEPILEGEKSPSTITAGADPAMIMAIEDGAVATEWGEKGREPHDGTCPYTQQCETRRRRLPTYRPEVPCHWAAWGDWARCPIYRRNGGNNK